MGVLLATSVRQLRVVCPPGMLACPDDDAAARGLLQCVDAPVCPSTAATPTTLSAPAAATSEVVVEPPTLKLLGPSTVFLTAGASYRRCPSTASSTAADCDHGALAFDQRDGDLTNVVAACAGLAAATTAVAAQQQQRRAFSVIGLGACGLPDRLLPGVRVLQFRCACLLRPPTLLQSGLDGPRRLAPHRTLVDLVSSHAA